MVDLKSLKMCITTFAHPHTPGFLVADDSSCWKKNLTSNNVLSCEHATLQPAMTVGSSVCLSSHPSIRLI